MNATSLKASGGGQLLPPQSLSFEDVTDYLGGGSDVPSRLGKELDEQERLSMSEEAKLSLIRYERAEIVSKPPGKERIEAAARLWSDKHWRTPSAKGDDGGKRLDEDARYENGLLRRARVMNCVAALTQYKAIPFIAAEDLIKYAKQANAAAGAVCVGILKTYEQWRTQSPEKGLAEVYAFMRKWNPAIPATSHDEADDAFAFRVGKAQGARRKAALLLADSEVVMSAWVGIWNRRAISRARNLIE